MRKNILSMLLAVALLFSMAGYALAEEQQLLEADVIVIGAGGAGLAAAASAGSQGASVIVLEAGARAGGATLLSGGHMAMLDEEKNAGMERNDAELETYMGLLASKQYAFGDTLETLKKQIEAYTSGDQAGRFDSVERMLIDQFAGGHQMDIDGVAAFVDIQLVEPALRANMDILKWLCEDGGMQLEDTIYKTHGNTPVGKGVGLVDALMNLAEKANARIDYNTRATGLEMENGKVTRVIAVDKDGKEKVYTAKCGVVLATGGFTADTQMCSDYQRMGTGLTAENPNTNVSTNRGDGIRMAQELGAKLRDMQFISTILLGYNNGCTPTEMPLIDGKHQLIVNADAERYGNDQTTSTISSATNNQAGGIAYMIGDQKMIEAMNAAKEGIVDNYVKRGWVYVADTLEEAASAAGLNAAKVMHTVQAFNAIVDAGEDPDYGRTNFNGKVEEGPYLVAKMQMHYHLTLGGLVIDADARVYDEDKNVIPGLYAAGDVISGIEGAVHQTNSNLTAVIYYGKVAGENAVAMADAQIPEKKAAQTQEVPASTPLEMSPVEELLAGEMMVLPSGTFMMGTPEDEPFRDDLESPMHEVSIKSFAVGKYPVTYKQYRIFCAATNRELPEANARTSFDGSREWANVGRWDDPFPGAYEQSDMHPVTCVTWYDAKDFCAWLSEVTGHEYRLLTEAEYEYAVRAGTTTPYYTGDTVKNTEANFGRYYGSTTTASGTFPPNPWGLYDMMGNSWSWVEDDFANQNYENAPTDGSAWVIEGATKKGCRGASWNVDGLYLRSGNRDGYAPDVRYSRLGFRIARTLEE